MKSRFAGLCFVVVLGASATVPAAGQSTSRVGGGLTIGMTPNLSEGFSTDQICPTRSAVSASARATLALTTIIQLEAVGETFKGRGINCVDGLVPPVPPSGPYSRRFDFYDGRITDPPTVLSLRVGGSFPRSRTFVLRPYAGLARFSGKRITSPLAGLSFLVGGSQPRLLLEIEGLWYSVPKQHLEEEFFDGQLVRRSMSERGVRTFTTILRVGFASIAGRG